MPMLVEFGLHDLAVALGIIITLAALAGVAFYTFRSQKKKVKSDAVSELKDISEALRQKVELFEEDLKEARSDHAKCERKLNRIAAFNLRLQAREMRYQKTINQLEAKLGLDVTDFNDMSETPDEDFNT